MNLTRTAARQSAHARLSLKRALGAAAFVLAAVVTLVVANVWTRAPSGAHHAGSAMRFDVTEHDWGTVRGDIADLEHTFTLRNVGREAIVIKEVTTSCGCTVAELQKRRIAPGDTAAIVARLHLNAVGRNLSEIRVVSNAGDATLRLRAFRQPLAQAASDPRILDLGGDRSGGLLVNVWTLFDEPFSVARIETRSGRLTITTRPARRTSPESADGYVQTSFALRIAADGPATAWNDELTVTFSDARISPLFIPVHVPAPAQAADG